MLNKSDSINDSLAPPVTLTKYLKGFSPVCARMCSRNAFLCLTRALHTGHTWLLYSPRCLMRMCTLRLLARNVAKPHYSNKWKYKSVKQFINCVKILQSKTVKGELRPAYIHTLVLNLNSQCNLQTHRFKLQDVIFSCELLHKIQQKEKQKPQQGCTRMAIISHAYAASFGNWTQHPATQYMHHLAPQAKESIYMCACTHANMHIH